MKLLAMNDKSDPHEVQETIDKWVSEGAIPCEGVMNIADNRYTDTYCIDTFAFVGVTIEDNTTFFSNELETYMTQEEMYEMVTKFITKDNKNGGAL